jgi:hypothetical protein
MLDGLKNKFNELAKVENKFIFSDASTTEKSNKKKWTGCQPYQTSAK